MLSYPTRPPACLPTYLPHTHTHSHTHTHLHMHHVCTHAHSHVKATMHCRHGDVIEADLPPKPFLCWDMRCMQPRVRYSLDAGRKLHRLSSLDSDIGNAAYVLGES